MEINRNEIEDCTIDCRDKSHYLIVTRHGERADKESEDNCLNYHDTNLTFKGEMESRITGENLVDHLTSLGLLETLETVEIITSPYFRCLQTSKNLIFGIYEALIRKGYKKLARNFLDRNIHIEEAFAERICGRSSKHYKKLFINFKKNLLEEVFPEFKFEKNTLFDYEKGKGMLKGSRKFKRSSDLFNCCFASFWDLTQRIVKKKADRSLTIVVAHGMFIEIFSYFLKLETRMKQIDYNATTMIKVNGIERIEDDGYAGTSFNMIDLFDVIFDCVFENKGMAVTSDN